MDLKPAIHFSDASQSPGCRNLSVCGLGRAVLIMGLWVQATETASGYHNPKGDLVEEINQSKC